MKTYAVPSLRTRKFKRLCAGTLGTILYFKAAILYFKAARSTVDLNSLPICNENVCNPAKIGFVVFVKSIVSDTYF